MRNSDLFSTLVGVVERQDSRMWDPRIQVVYGCDIWDSGIKEKRSFMSSAEGQIAVYLTASEKWTTSHNISPLDSGAIYALCLAKWLGWDSASIITPPAS